AQQQPQIPHLPQPLVQILIAHQQLQSHLSAATRQGKSVFSAVPSDLMFIQRKGAGVVKKSNLFIFNERGE
ncbi:hypothetical protein, partial [Streptococcus pyogenes]|uniref:hypothetical protein n=1 Tax=Streptococcus pyogenes TaxID=1314 RepID=UPI003DA1C2AB